MDKQDFQTVQSLERGLVALEMAVRGPVKSADVAEALGVDRSTAYRLLYTLKVKGYLHQDPMTREFVPNPGKFLALTSQVTQLMNWQTIAVDFLKALRDRTGETANLGVLEDHEIVYIGQQAAHEPLIVNHSLGTRRPLHCSALGKAILAFLPDAEVERLALAGGLTARTPKTITQLDVLKSHLAGVREQGYAVDDEETFEGVRCVAAPIRDHAHLVIASIGISGPSVRVTREKIPALAKVVTQIANEISTLLGRTPSPTDHIRAH